MIGEEGVHVYIVHIHFPAMVFPLVLPSAIEDLLHYIGQTLFFEIFVELALNLKMR